MRGIPQDDTDARQWFYCRDAGCHTVYFNDSGLEIDKSALTIRVGEKEPDPPHTVCYCFGHTREDIELQIARSGETSIPASIKAKVQAGACRCEEMNPKGTCCLGDVAREVKRAMRAADPTRVGDDEIDCNATADAANPCCDASPPAEDIADGSAVPRRATFTALGLAALIAIGASACCWLPLLAVGLGATSVGLAATFGGLRPYLLVLAPLLLALSFYTLYVRRSPCADDAACDTRGGGGNRTAKRVFWIAVALLIASIAFPSAMAALQGGSAATQTDRVSGLAALRMTVTGMTCETCAASIRSALLKVPGVVDAAADHDAGTATVWYEPARMPTQESLRAAIEHLGYVVETVREYGPRSGPG